MADLQSFLAENRNKQPVSPPVDLRAAIEKTNTKQENQGADAYLKNMVNSVNRGMTQMIEFPYNTVNRAPQIVNLFPGEQGVGTLDEMGIPGFKEMGKDPLINLVAKHYPGMDGIGGIAEPNTNYPITSNIAEGFGSGLGGMGLIKTATVIPGVVGKFAQYLNAPIKAAPKTAVAAELASSGGGELGRVVAEDNDMGPITTMAMQFLGSLGPGTLAYAGPKVLGAGARWGSEEGIEGASKTLAALDRQNIRPSIGLTGGKMASQVESGASALPFFSAIPEKVQGKQFNQFSDALTGAADEIMPGSTGPKGIDLPQQVYDIAEGGAKKMRSGFGGREDALMNTIGLDTLVDTTNLRAAFVDQIKYATGDTKNALVKQLNALDEVADASGNVPAQSLRNWRSQFGASIEEQGLLKGAKSQIYKGVTADLDNAANKAGVGDDFRNLMSEQAAAYADDIRLSEGGDLPQAEKITSKQLESSGQFLKQAYANPDKMDYIKRNATPEQWNQLRANIAQDLGLAKAGAQDATGDIVSPNKFLTEWNKMDPRVKNMLFDDDLGTRQTLDDLALVAEAFKRRGGEANSSRTAGTGLSAMQIREASKLPVGGATGYGLATNAPATLAGIGLTYATVKGLMSETLARWAAGQTPTAAGTVGARLPGAAAQLGTDDTEAEERPPLRITVRPSDANRK